MFNKKGKKFIYKKYPQLWSCKEKAEDLIDEMYSKEGEYEEGNCSQEDWDESVKISLDYSRNVLGKAIHETFYGKGILIFDTIRNENILFDKYFPAPFEGLSNQKKGLLSDLLDGQGTLRLPDEYYH